MEMLQEVNVCEPWKCGEITTFLSIGKKEFFLNCELCDYTVQSLERFINHIYESHLEEFTQANSRPPSAELYDQPSDEDTEYSNNVEEMENENSELPDFENVAVDMGQTENSTQFKVEIETIPTELVISESEEESLPSLNVVELSEDDGEYNVGNSMGNSSCSKESREKSKIKEKDFMLEFIKVYQSLPALWNVNDLYYHNRAVRAKQYNILLKKYKQMYPNAVLNDVRNRINNFRTNCRKERLGIQTSSTKSKLYYYNALSFLKDSESHSESKAKSDVSDHLQLPEDVYKKLSAGLKLNLEFIELYKSMTSLWDTNDPGYRNRELIKKNFLKLLEKYKEMCPNAGFLDLKKKLNYMRAKYYQELRRCRKTGVKSKAYYFKALSFLRDINATNRETNEISCDIPVDDALLEKYLQDYDISVQENFGQFSFTRNNVFDPQDAQKREEKCILELIELYKTMPSIWDTNSPDYHDQELKDKNYKILLEKYKEKYRTASLQDLKVKINILRTNYNIESKQIAMGETKESKLYYFEALNFLRNNE